MIDISTIMPVYDEKHYLREAIGSVDDIRRKYQIEFINRYKSANQQMPDEWTVGIPEIVIKKESLNKLLYLSLI